MIRTKLPMSKGFQ